MVQDKPPRKKRLAPRSRSGCLECRRHHRKCDERRPICELCQKNGRNCQYGLRITWGGRPFQRSNFGQCMAESKSHSKSVVRVQSTPLDEKSSLSSSAFVYGIAEAASTSPPSASLSEFAVPTQDQRLQLIPRSIEAQHAETILSIGLVPSLLPDLPPVYRSLLDHFLHVADSFSCDEAVKTDFYSTFVPMAMNTSHLLASMLNLAAIHRISAGLDQNKKQLALLQVVAVEQLREKLASTSGPPTEPIMATILMLCYAEVVAGGEKSHSWRMHLEGAASLFGRDLSEWSVHSPNSTKAFITRCFVSLIALANISGSPPTDSISKQALLMTGGESHMPYIDEFTAYSTDLVYIFSEIGALVRERENMHHAEDNLTTNLEERTMKLINQLQIMMKNGRAQLKNRICSNMSLSRKQEYLNINEAYHHAALLQIYQRILRLPSSANEIQVIVRRILTLLSGVKLLNGPCPGIVLLFPTFSAGCGAIEPSDRQQVLTVMKSMIEMYGIVNVHHSLKILQALWAHRDEHGESEINQSWEKFIGEHYCRPAVLSHEAYSGLEKHLEDLQC